MGTPLIQEEERIKEVPTPTPSQGGELWKSKSLANKDETTTDGLTWARATFTGVMKDMQDHLFQSRPPMPRLKDGYTDWQEYGLRHWGVERAEWRGDVMALVLAVPNTTRTEACLAKYHRKWDDIFRKWFECEFEIELVQSEGGR